MKRNIPKVIKEGERREIILYRTAENAPKVEVLLQQQNLWLTQKVLSILFGVERSVITKHIKNIFITGELQENSVCAKFAHTAEDRAKSRKVMYMNDWIEKLNAFLQFNEREILQDNGRVTHEIAKAFAENEFEKYRVIQDRTYKSDFDKLIESTENN